MRTLACIATGLALAACSKSDPAPAATGSAPASAPPVSTVVNGVPISIPLAADKVVAKVNHDKRAPYAGPKATLRGKVRMEGDPPPDTGLKFPANCRESEATYGKLFRLGLDKALADVMVTVTGYDGFVPAESDVHKVTIHGCATGKRTYAVTYGQRIDVSNLDKLDSYLPYLDGAPVRAVMVTVPQGPPTKLYPVESPAHYMIRDQMPSNLVADVFVLNYATHDVTGLDGQYEIKGIPVGKVRVSAFLPVISMVEEKAIEVKEGDNTLDFTMRFDLEALKKQMARPATSASAAPAQPPPKASGEPMPKPPR
jgi:hypothetical protein